jgi:DNA-binding LytR/AlgR family response regulator
MKRKILIVDDEPRAHTILENYLQRLSDTQLAGKFTSALEAVDFLKSNHVDIVLLDITMPQVDGFAFLRMQEEPPLVIFTTAHSEFALESYDYSAVDYLKKPIPFDRFEKAITKALAILKTNPERSIPKEIELKIDGELRTIAFNNILYMQSLGNYLKIHTPEKMWLTQITTHYIEESLPKEVFIRIHKSYIVNRKKIERLTDDEVIIQNTKLPIGKTFKKYVRESLSQPI